MKLVTKALLVGAVLIVVIFNISHFKKFLQQGALAAESLPKPYLVEIVPADGGAVKSISGRSLAQALFDVAGDVGAEPYSKDRFTAFPDIKMGIGGKITMFVTPEYKVKDGRKEYVLRSWAKTVGEMLSEENIELGQDDKINFAPDFALEPGLDIVIIRVARTLVTEAQPIAYQTIKKNDPALEKGLTMVEQKGKKGKKNLIYEVVREDGIQISKTLKRTEKVSDPVDELVMVGTKVTVLASGKATWYRRNQKLVAASNSLPKGTRVNVVNLTNGKNVVVTVDDHGIQTDAVIDLSADAFSLIGDLGAGVINVQIEKWSGS